MEKSFFTAEFLAGLRFGFHSGLLGDLIHYVLHRLIPQPVIIVPVIVIAIRAINALLFIIFSS